MCSAENYEVRTAENGSAGLEALDAFQPDLVVLDLMLPDCSGYDLCKEITKRQAVPVIMLSAKNEIIDKVLGLELGAEDYMTKPFDNRELLARIKVVLRRAQNSGLPAEAEDTRITHEEPDLRSGDPGGAERRRSGGSDSQGIPDSGDPAEAPGQNLYPG